MDFFLDLDALYRVCEYNIPLFSKVANINNCYSCVVFHWPIFFLKKNIFVMYNLCVDIPRDKGFSMKTFGMENTNVPNGKYDHARN